MPSDLHTHTNVSDGVLTPEELLEAAKKAGLTYLAITDHDTVDGIIQLYESGLYPTRGLHVIPGIEFSAHHASHDIVSAAIEQDGFQFIDVFEWHPGSFVFDKASFEFE